jgi:hypothetical protein
MRLRLLNAIKHDPASTASKPETINHSTFAPVDAKERVFPESGAPHVHLA